MSVFNRDLVVQLLNKILGKADLTVTKTDEVLGDTKKILTAVSGGMGAVKSVQRGTARFTAKVTEVSSAGGFVIQVIPELKININSVNPNKCIVLLNGAPYHHSTAIDTTVTNVPCLSKVSENQLILSLAFPDSPTSWQQSNFNLGYRPKVNDIITVKNLVSWQLIEYY